MKENLKNKKGITLIALVITIIVLLILAIVTIRIVVNQNIINHANNAVTAYNEAQQNESEQLTWVEGLMKNKGGSSSSGSGSDTGSSSDSQISNTDLTVLTEEEKQQLKEQLEGTNDQIAIAGNPEGEEHKAIIAQRDKNNNNKIFELQMIVGDKFYFVFLNNDIITSLKNETGFEGNIEINKLYEVGENTLIPCTTNVIKETNFSPVVSQAYLNRIIALVDANI